MLKTLVFCWKTYLENLLYIVTFALQFFCVASYGAATLVQIRVGLVDAQPRPNILGNKLGILTLILIAIGYYSFSLHFRRAPPSEAATQRCSEICSKFTGEHPCRSVNFGMGVLLQICCIFSEHLFLATPVSGCF